MKSEQINSEIYRKNNVLIQSNLSLIKLNNELKEKVTRLENEAIESSKMIRQLKFHIKNLLKAANGK